MGNRFSECTSVIELLGQMVGAASVCWENPGGAGVFDDKKALDVANEGLARLIELHDHWIRLTR